MATSSDQLASDQHLSFRYRPQLKTVLWPIVMLTAVGLFCGYQAQTWEANKRMVINGLVELNPEQVLALWWGLASLCLAFILIAVLGVSHRYFSADQYLILGADHVLIPGTLMGKTKQIRWADIRDLRLNNGRGTKLLAIRTHDGQHGVIHNRFLTPEQFNTVVGEVTSRQAET